MRTIHVVSKTPTEAQLLVLDFNIGKIQVNADARLLCPSTRYGALRIYGALSRDAVEVEDVLEDIEAVASSLFPEFEDCGVHWVWDLIEDCNPCKCHNCLN